MLAGAWQRLFLPRDARRARGRLATTGLQVVGNRLCLARVRQAPGAAPQLEALQPRTFESGQLSDAARALAQAGLLEGARVVFVLSAEQYDVHAIASPPPVPEDELAEALRWQMREVLSYPPDEAVFDFVHLPQPAGAAARPGVLAVAAPRRKIAHALSPLLTAGIEIEAVEIPEMAQRNLQSLAPLEGNCQAFLSFDSASCLLTVQFGDDLCFARRVPTSTGEGRDDPEPDRFAERVAGNVHRSFEVFEAQSSLPHVARLVVGPHPQAATIAQRIAERSGLETALFDPGNALGNSRIYPRDAESTAMDLLGALGGALRYPLASEAPAQGPGIDPRQWLRRDRKAA